MSCFCKTLINNHICPLNSYGKDYYVYFSGIFDGNGHMIKNLNVKCGYHSGNSWGRALFGAVTGVVRNLAVDGNITGINPFYTGSIAAYAGYKASFENCVNYCTLNMGGGILGYNYAASENQIFNCVNYGTGADAGLIYKLDTYYHMQECDNCFWLYDVASNLGNQYSGNGFDFFHPEKNNRSFTYADNSNLLAPSYNEDLVENLNYWVYMNSGDVHYNNWEYKKMNGKCVAVLIPDE